MNTPICYCNGKLIPYSASFVSLNDLGLQRGYGIFDFVRVAENVPLFWEDHLDRFYHSAKEMRLPLSQSRNELKSIISELISINQLPHAGIKIILTGGASPDGYSIGSPNLFIIQQAITSPAESIFLPGFKLFTYPHQRQLPEVKTTDYLMAIHLQPWLKERGGDDILYQQNGRVTECPRSNFFIVTKNDTLITPGNHVLKGITRKQLFTIASSIGIVTEEREISIKDIEHAKEAFITSSTKRIIPVTQVDTKLFAPFVSHSVTDQLFKAFCEWEKTAIKNHT